MTDTMLKKAIAAFREQARQDPACMRSGGDGSICFDGEIDPAEYVRAVLISIRLPDGAMRDAARDWSIAKYGQGVGYDGTDGCWQSQIDSILKGQVT